MPPVCFIIQVDTPARSHPNVCNDCNADDHCPQKQAENAQHPAQNHSDLSEEDKKILEDAHKNRNNPDHPAHEKHPEVRIPSRRVD
jgi:hypothetical protein